MLQKTHLRIKQLYLEKFPFFFSTVVKMCFKFEILMLNLKPCTIFEKRNLLYAIFRTPKFTSACRPDHCIALRTNGVHEYSLYNITKLCFNLDWQFNFLLGSLRFKLARSFWVIALKDHHYN